MKKHALALVTILSTGGMLAGCGAAKTTTASAPKSSSTATTAKSSAASTPKAGTPPAISGSNPFKGKTINFQTEGSAGTSADLMARLLSPYMAKYLHATVNVLDMPGGGGLKEWNATAQAAPNGLTIGIGYVQGMAANVWEKVPGQNFNPTKLTWLGGFTGTGGVGQDTMFTIAKTPPANSAANLVKDHTKKVTELGAIGDVSGPLFFRVYHIPYVDLTSYSGANTQLTGLLRGDGQVDVKTYSANWKSNAEAGKIKPIMVFAMTKTWSVNPSVPTIGTFMKSHPLSAGGKAAMVADASALDAGWGMFAPPGTPSRQATLLRDAIAWAFTQKPLTAHFVKVGLAPKNVSGNVELSALKVALKSSTVTLMRKYLPLSKGAAS